MRRFWIVGLVVALAALAVAMLVLPKDHHHRKITVSLRTADTGVHAEICPPYCGFEPVTTTAPPTTSTVPAPVTVPPVPETSPPAPTQPPAPVASPGATGGRSWAWWEAIATCESGNTNAWRTGYYGLEGGAGVTFGQMSKEQQLAIAQDIYSRYGDGAWGCAPVAWANVPGG